MQKADSVEGYIEENNHFLKELTLLREIILKTDLEESIKWNAPVYASNGKNVVGLGAFKNHFGIWFFNGVFLKDENNLLEQAQAKTKGLRQMRFESIMDIDENAVLRYVQEAIENQKLGKEIKPNRQSKTVKIPNELLVKFQDDKLLESSFKKLTPGKQREYCDYIATAMRETTKTTRLDKIKPMILKGVGLHDKYKNC